MITSPTPGTFVIALHFKGRDKPIVEMDLKIDDLLEKASIDPNCPGGHATNEHPPQQKESNTMLDLEYVQLHVNKILALLNKVSTPLRTAFYAYTLFSFSVDDDRHFSVSTTILYHSISIPTVPLIHRFTTRIAIHIVVCAASLLEFYC